MASSVLVKLLSVSLSDFSADGVDVVPEGARALGLHVPGGSFAPEELHLIDSDAGDGGQVADGTYLNREHGYQGDGPVPPIPDDVRVEAIVRYARVFEMITGDAFEPDLDEPQARIRGNLGV